MTALVLTYHSHRVVGATYALNDLVALPVDLELLTQEKVRIVSLSELVDRVASGLAIREDIAALTFDDGPAYDFRDFSHPLLGVQDSFRTSLSRFRKTRLGSQQPTVCATSFVIASPEARLVMERAADTASAWLAPGSMNEAWWNEAIDDGIISIANHSWDHLHPALETVAHSRQVRGDFTAVDNLDDADAQIASAARYLVKRTGNRAAPYFAYPFGNHNEFLVETYFPHFGSALGIEAAFTADPYPIRGGESRWRLPRFVCGHHWKSPEELRALLLTGTNHRLHSPETP